MSKCSMSAAQFIRNVSITFFDFTSAVTKYRISFSTEPCANILESLGIISLSGI